jgi:hypothetical protein
MEYEFYSPRGSSPDDENRSGFRKESYNIQRRWIAHPELKFIFINFTEKSQWATVLSFDPSSH